MKPLLFVFALLMLCSSCSKEKITGSGNTITRERTVPAFSAVSNAGSNNVYITKGNTLKVELSGYENLIPYFETTVVNNELRLRFRSGVTIRNNNLKVYIRMPEISFLNLQGSGNIYTTGNFISTNSIDLLVSGSGTIYFDEGSSPRALLRVAGSGQIHAYGLQATESDAGIDGSGFIKTAVLDKLTAHISGSGNIYYKGSPVELSTIVSGSGQVIKE
jgi:hypothetical protein